MTELNGKRPLLPKERPLSELNLAPEVIDCLETFRLIAEMGEESLGAYVISMAQRPSDVLAVKLLMKEFGLKRCERDCCPSCCYAPACRLTCVPSCGM